MEPSVGYTRISQEDKKRPGISLDAQSDAITAFAKANGFEMGAIVDDKGVSGGKPLRRRPGGATLLNMLRAQPRVLIVSKLDRLTRRVGDAANLFDEFNRLGVRLISISEPWDIREPQGRLFALLAVLFGEYELESGFARSQAARVKLKADNRLLGSQSPYGWRAGPDKVLVKEEAEQKIRSRILRLHSFGHGPGKIATILTGDGVLARGGNPWSKGTVRSVLERAGRRPGRPAQTDPTTDNENTAPTSSPDLPTRCDSET